MAPGYFGLQDKNGGLHNPVWLLVMDDVYFSPEDYGMYRLRYETPVVPRRKLSPMSGLTSQRGNRDAGHPCACPASGGHGAIIRLTARSLSRRSLNMTFDHEFILSGMHLLEGMKDPYPGHDQGRAVQGKEDEDIAETKVGYRSIGMTGEDSFLNGRPYPPCGDASGH